MGGDLDLCSFFLVSCDASLLVAVRCCGATFAFFVSKKSDAMRMTGHRSQAPDNPPLMVEMSLCGVCCMFVVVQE